MESDILLTKERQASDIADFDRIVDLHRKQVYGLAYQLTGNHEDADDISQEVFIRAYKSIGKFRGGARLSTWLYRITVNLSVNHLKKKSKHTHGYTKILDTSPDSIVSDWSKNPLQDIEAEELAQRIRMATESDKWTKVSDMPTARWGLSASVVRDRIYAIGGADSNNVGLSVSEEYDTGYSSKIVEPKEKLAIPWGEIKTK